MSDQRQLGRFTIIGELASTTHSRVWEAVDENGVHVAVKELKVRSADKEPYRRFRDEVSFHRSGPHPGVLPVLDAHVPEKPSKDDPAWLAMPIAETVRDALGSDSTLDEVVAAVATYARTLASLAEIGVHHRDLKPDNLFRFAGEWMVGDFGLVTWPGKDAQTAPGQKLGPANFVAPEMIRDATEVDAGPADVWSLAKVLWVLAIGENYPPPGQLRVDIEATRLREWTTHPRAAGLEGILEQATDLDPTRRPPMSYFAAELQTWLTPRDPLREPAGLDDLAARTRAISAPAIAARHQQAELDREGAAIAGRLRAAHKILAPHMEKLGHVIADNSSLMLHGLGGKSKRGDVTSTWTESLTLAPNSPTHQVSLTIDLAWQRLTAPDIHLMVGIYLRDGVGRNLTQTFMLETREARLGTEHAERMADELVQLVIDGFNDAAPRYVELLEAAEARAQANRQPRLESLGINYIFRTEARAGVVTIIRREDNSIDGQAMAWHDAPITKIEADGDRARVEAGNLHGWIERNINQRWVLASEQPDEHG